MTDEFRARLREEMAAQQRPPLGDIVTTAVNDGRRSRRSKRLVAGAVASAAGVAVVAVALGGQVLLGSSGRGHSVSTAAGADVSAAASDGSGSVLPAVNPSASLSAAQRAALASQAAARKARASAIASGPPEAQASTTPSPNATATPPSAAQPVTPASASFTPSGHDVAATPEAMLELLKDVLPASAKISGVGAFSDDSLHVQAYIDDGQGPGMVRISVLNSVEPKSALAATCTGDMATCSTLSDGSTVAVLQLPDNCVQRTSVQLFRPDGVGVQIDDATCLAYDTTSATNPPAPQPLTVDQAVAIADSPYWGTSMDSALVSAGQRDFGSLPVLQ